METPLRKPAVSLTITTHASSAQGVSRESIRWRPLGPRCCPCHTQPLFQARVPEELEGEGTEVAKDREKGNPATTEDE